jgi:hypothetical protein
MDTPVKVVGDESGNVINVSSNPEYGYVRLEQVKSIIDENGFLRRKTRSALIQGTIDELKACGFYAGQVLPGKIVVLESLTPFNEKDPNRDLKVAGSTGIPCTQGGQPIYRKSLYTASLNRDDVTVDHDNIDELRAAYEAQSKSEAIKPNEEFNV